MTYPILEWVHEGNADIVKMNGQPLTDIRDKRYLRFTSKDGDERWIGADWNGTDGWMGIDWGFIDLCCWGYYDPTLWCYENHSIEFEDHPEEGWFRLNMRGGKPVMECRNDSWLKGIWQEEEQCFRYEFSTEFECELEELYQHSFRCQKEYAENPTEPTNIQVFDYFIFYSSFLDIPSARNFSFPRPLYHWFIMSEDGKNWVRSPKVHIPPIETFEDRENDLCWFPTCYGKENSFFGFVDKEYGGWVVRTLETPTPISHIVCWAFYDIHVDALKAVPPRGSCEKVNLRYSCEFMPVTAERAKEIVASSREYYGRQEARYDVPRFSFNNRFDDSLRLLPGDEVGQMHFWYRSDSNCSMDHTIGYDDTDSVKIERSGENPQPSAWFCLRPSSWLDPYDTIPQLGRRYRMSAMVKTENCTGKVRIGKVSMAWGGDIFYGVNTHYADGEPKAHGGTFGGMDKELDLHWAFSESITGTRDWTPLSIEFDALDGVMDVLLEMSGAGKCWFDNVFIEDIGVAERIVERGDIRIREHGQGKRFREHWQLYDTQKHSLPASKE